MLVFAVGSECSKVDGRKVKLVSYIFDPHIVKKGKMKEHQDKTTKKLPHVNGIIICFCFCVASLIFNLLVCLELFSSWKNYFCFNLNCISVCLLTSPEGNEATAIYNVSAIVSHSWWKVFCLKEICVLTAAKQCHLWHFVQSSLLLKFCSDVPSTKALFWYASNIRQMM